MDIKHKLSTLSQRLPPPPQPAVGSAATLAALRARMAELLTKSALSPPSEPLPETRFAAETDTSELPFVIEHTEHGVLWRRQQVLAPSTHVGRIPVEAARDACPHMLALLALSPDLSGCQPHGAVFLDTETTGLGGTGAIAFLVGLAWFEASGRLVLEQLLLRAPQDEPALLEHLRQRLLQSSLLVTYNGKSFDMPLLMGRYVMNRLPEPAGLPHLDLLHVARRLHRERLGHCRLVSLESGVLGFERGDDIPGAEIAPLYSHYLRTGDGGVLRPVVEHNAWDVMSMAALTGLYGEPLAGLHAEDLVGMAKTLKRAGALAQANEVAQRALDRGAGPNALFVRGQIAKARGDKQRALADFERLSEAVDDARVRLELAKLYEHFVKQPLKALKLLDLGTGEGPLQLEKRRERLLRKSLK